MARKLKRNEPNWQARSTRTCLFCGKIVRYEYMTKGDGTQGVFLRHAQKKPKVNEYCWTPWIRTQAFRDLYKLGPAYVTPLREQKEEESDTR